MVRKSTNDAASSRLKRSFIGSNTSVSSCDSVSSSVSSCESVSSSASSATRLGATARPAAARTSVPATDRGTGAKLSRVKSLHVDPITKPLPVPRRARPSLGAVQPPNLTSDAKQTSKPAAHAPLKRRPSIAGSTRSGPAEKVPSSSSSSAATSKPPFGLPSSAATFKPPLGQPSAAASKPPPSQPSAATSKPPLSQPSAAAIKPPHGQPRMVVKGAVAAAATKFSRKK